MPRLFTALGLPADIGMSLSFLRGGLPGARWISPENYHVTLRFIGDVDSRTADEVAGALGDLRQGDFDLHLEGLGAFGSRRPHSLWAGLGPSTGLRDLQGEQERLMQRIGLEPERRKWTPHVTLARLKQASGGDVAAYLALRGGFRTADFHVGRFVLLSSRDSTSGGPYLMEEAYPLAA